MAEKLNALKIAKATGSIPENTNFAIKAGTLRDFLDNNVASYRTAELNVRIEDFRNRQCRESLYGPHFVFGQASRKRRKMTFLQNVLI